MENNEKKPLGWFMEMDMRLATLLLFLITWGPAYLLGLVEGTPGRNDGFLDYIIASLWAAPFVIIIGLMITNTVKRKRAEK